MRAAFRRAQRQGASGVAAAVVALLALAALPERARAAPPPAQDYALECRGCHGAHGEGTPGKVPSLAETARFLVSPRGRAYLVRVPGVAGSQLSNARLAALLDWMLRELASNPPAPAGFARFSEAEVAAARVRPLLEPLAERENVLADAP